MHEGRKVSWATLLVAAALGCATGLLFSPWHGQPAAVAGVHLRYKPRDELRVDVPPSLPSSKDNETWPVAR